ncbi:MAG: hypothetical protein KDK70_14485 [Myxococcales bacterium]|nr:hypothetical protein [Myxococcales bacterium]
MLALAGCPSPGSSDGPSTASTASTTDLPPTGTSTGLADSTGAPSTGDPASTDTGEVPLPTRLGVTADWLARTLTVIDLDALAAGARTREQIVARTIDLADHAPGPLQVELTPDGLTAVVSVSPGFFGGLVGGLIGAGEVEQAGTLLLVDLPTGAVTEVATTHVPMGIAVAPDGSRAYTANYGLDDPVGSTVSIVDLPSGRMVDELEVGARPEQIALDEAGTLAILNVASLGAIRVFATDDPAGTLSDPMVIGSDPSDVAFVPGTPYAVATNSQEPSNYVVIDVSEPAVPVEVSVGPSPLGICYGATLVPGTSDVVLTANDFLSVYLRRVTVGGDGSLTTQWEVPHPAPAFAMGVAVDANGGVAIAAAPGAGANALLIQPLDGGPGRSIAWQDAVGPAYVAVVP